MKTHIGCPAAALTIVDLVRTSMTDMTTSALTRADPRVPVEQ